MGMTNSDFMPAFNAGNRGEGGCRKEAVESERLYRKWLSGSEIKIGGTWGQPGVLRTRRFRKEGEREEKSQDDVSKGEIILVTPSIPSSM